MKTLANWAQIVGDPTALRILAANTYVGAVKFDDSVSVTDFDNVDTPILRILPSVMSTNPDTCFIPCQLFVNHFLGFGTMIWLEEYKIDDLLGRLRSVWLNNVWLDTGMNPTEVGVLGVAYEVSRPVYKFNAVAYFVDIQVRVSVPAPVFP